MAQATCPCCGSTYDRPGPSGMIFNPPLNSTAHAAQLARLIGKPPAPPREEYAMAPGGRIDALKARSVMLMEMAAASAREAMELAEAEALAMEVE